MKQIPNRFSLLVIALVFAFGAMAACGTKENSINNDSASAVENKAIENKSVNNEMANGQSAQSEADGGKDNSAIKALRGNDEKLRQQTLDAVLQRPHDYNPVVLCVLSDVLFEQEKRDEASFWFYTCQLRARIDSNLSTDKSTETAVSRLNQMFGPKINKYAFQDLNNLENIVNKAVDFVKNNEENYDRSWIYNSGMEALRSAMEKKEAAPPLKPKAEWAAIKKETIDNYAKGFSEAKKKASEMKK